MQELVGGNIELYSFPDWDCWLNEEGKLIGLLPNFPLVRNGEVVDIVMGDVFFSRSDGEDIASVTDEDFVAIKKMIQESRDKLISIVLPEE